MPQTTYSTNSLFGQWGQSGMDLEKYLQQLMSGGLGEYGETLKREGEGAIGGRVRTGTQDLREQFASKGNVSARAINKGFSEMSSSGAGALQNLYSDIEGKNMQARQMGATGMQGALGQLGQLAELKRQFDEGNSFDFFKDLFGPLLSAGGQLGGAALASDRKLKTNIRKLCMIKGINIYSFNYIDNKFGEGKQIGVMADEVEFIPNAVIDMPYGKAVNYSIVTNYLR